MMCAKSWHTPCRERNACSIGEFTAVLFFTYVKLRYTPDATSIRKASGLRPSLFAFRRGPRKMARHQRVPIIFFLIHFLHVIPDLVIHRFRQGLLLVYIY